MPIYEYECQKCGHHHEVLQKISEDPLKTCPACKADALKKLISAAGFRLSGSGWYETDFKSGNQKNLAKKDGEKSKDSKGKKKDKKADTNSSKNKSSTANTTKKSSSNAS